LVAGHLGTTIVAVPRNADVKGFQVPPRRWVVERTFAWIGRCGRLARDHERKTAHAEAMVEVAMIRLVLARLPGGRRAVRSDRDRSSSTPHRRRPARP